MSVKKLVWPKGMHRTHSPYPLRAVGLAIAAYTLWVLADTSLKIAGTSALPAVEVIGLVGAATAAMVAALSLCRGTPGRLLPRQPRRQLVRSGLDLANSVGVVTALRHLPLPLFYILVFATPMAVAVLAAVTLGETLDWRRGTAVIVGFAGVVVAVNPLSIAREDQPAGPHAWVGYLACLMCVLAFSTNIVLSRVMARTESPESLCFCSGVVAAVVGAVSLLHGAAPVSPKLAGVLCATGLFGLVGSLCFFAALRLATAATVSQFHYSQLLTGTLLAYLIWRERLTPPMVAGAVLIIAAGWYTAARSCSEELPLVEPV